MLRGAGFLERPRSWNLLFRISKFSARSSMGLHPTLHQTWMTSHRAKMQMTQVVATRIWMMQAAPTMAMAMAIPTRMHPWHMLCMFLDSNRKRMEVVRVPWLRDTTQQWLRQPWANGLPQPLPWRLHICPQGCFAHAVKHRFPVTKARLPLTHTSRIV